jgi:hypothetical protein
MPLAAFADLASAGRNHFKKISRKTLSNARKPRRFLFIERHTASAQIKEVKGKAMPKLT